MYLDVAGLLWPCMYYGIVDTVFAVRSSEIVVIDEFEDMEKVYELQQQIEKKCVEKKIQSKCANVILLNCMRSGSSELNASTTDTVFLGNALSEKELKFFEEKLVEIEKRHKNFETFYGFMIMKKNFKSEYIEGVVRNTLKSFNINQKNAKLLAVLVLLNVYCKGSSLSVSLCEDFLDLQPKPICGSIKVEDGFGKFSNFIASCSVEGLVVYRAVKVIHSSIARQCLQELKATHSVTKADIADLLLTTNQLYETQVFKHELKNAIANCKEVPVSPENVNVFLKMAQSAMDAFWQTQKLAKKESLQRVNSKTGNCPFNTSGCLGEIQVGVIITDLLAKVPVFSPDGVRHDIMSQVLAGDMKLESVQKNDPRHHKNSNYYDILRQFEDVLSNLKYRMKVNIDYLDKVFVNLGSRYGMKDSREQVAQNELFRCFKQYANVFCKTDSTHLLKNKMMSNKMKLDQIKLFLEKQKADTYSGILNCLSKKIPAEMMEKIVRHYVFIYQAEQNPSPKEKINFIYATVVLSRIKLESREMMPYPQLLKFLFQLLSEQTPISETLSLFFIAVALLWPSSQDTGCRNLGWYISQMKNSYHKELKEACNGKSPTVHFLLGNKCGYEQLVHIGEIKECIEAKQEVFESMWGNGKIWKEEKVRSLLCRATGEVTQGNILTNTCVNNLKLEVMPMYRSQISGYAEGSRVSFFIGFSLRGPLALDINVGP
uniref:Uncharacterized protein n=1 Tax=Nothobranchius kuhntae TaxID=321403 RepID=A0A1A8HVC2_NOTKU